MIPGRGMVETKDGQPVRENGHLKPVIDYPFAEDGLDVWYAMQDWFGAYLGLYYDNNVDGKRVGQHSFPNCFSVVASLHDMMPCLIASLQGHLAADLRAGTSAGD